MDAAEVDYYALLEIPYDADDAAIRAAYLRLAKKYHPDMHTHAHTHTTAHRGADGVGSTGPTSVEDAHAAFTAIKEAYECLSDDTTRRQYDMARAVGRACVSGRAWVREGGARRASHGSHAGGRTARVRVEDAFDTETWNSMHFGPTAAQAEAATAQRVREARATGFSAFNSGGFGKHADYEARRNARERVAAAMGASESAHYRQWAATFRAQRDAARRRWPLTLAIWTGIATGIYFMTRRVND